MGGYNKKQVTDYIDNLTENLRSAEESFNNRLEEYAAMITMLKQERDQYGEMYNLCKSSKIEMSNQIDELKNENEELSQLIKELSINQNPLHSESVHTDPREDSVESQKKLEEYLGYEQESKEMKAQLDLLKSMVRELNSELETYAKENITGYDSGNTFVEKKPEANDILKSQYDDILKERSALLAEKNRLNDENHKLTGEVSILNEQLKTINARCNERIQALLTDYEINAEEFIKNHQERMVQLAENMNSSLNLIKTEKDRLADLKMKMFLSEHNQE